MLKNKNGHSFSPRTRKKTPADFLEETQPDQRSSIECECQSTGKSFIGIFLEIDHDTVAMVQSANSSAAVLTQEVDSDPTSKYRA